MGLLFCKFENRKSYHIRDPALGFEKIGTHAFRIFNIKGILILIEIDAYTNSVPKKISRMISNWSVEKPNNNRNTDAVFLAYYCPGQPEESGKPEVNHKTGFLKLYIKSGSNKPDKVISEKYCYVYFRFSVTNENPSHKNQ